MTSPNLPKRFSITDRIAVAGILVTFLGIGVGFVTPELRCLFGLQSSSCVEINDARIEKIYQKAVFLYEHGKYLEALNSFDQVINLNSNHAKAWNGRGLALEKLSKNDLALASYDEALAIDPDYELARQNQYDLLLRK